MAGGAGCVAAAVGGGRSGAENMPPAAAAALGACAPNAPKGEAAAAGAGAGALACWGKLPTAAGGDGATGAG